jgi:hypothetical protein
MPLDEAAEQAEKYSQYLQKSVFSSPERYRGHGMFNYLLSSPRARKVALCQRVTGNLWLEHRGSILDCRQLRHRCFVIHRALHLVAPDSHQLFSRVVQSSAKHKYT